MGNLFGRFLDIIQLYPNLAATIFGGIAATVSGFFGYLLKRPLQRQALASELFRAQIDGYESLLKAQSARISYLESQQLIRDTHEADLMRRILECEERHMLDGDDS